MKMTFGAQPQNKPYQMYFIFVTDKMCSESHLYSHITTGIPSAANSIVNLSVCEQSILLKMNIPWGQEEGDRQQRTDRV